MTVTGPVIPILRMPTLTFKVSEDEARRIRAQAKAARTSLSEFLRTSALGDRHRVALDPVLRKHPASGLTFDATTGPVVREEEIKAALGDFP